MFLLLGEGLTAPVTRQNLTSCRYKRHKYPANPGQQSTIGLYKKPKQETPLNGLQAQQQCSAKGEAAALVPAGYKELQDRRPN